MGQVETKMIDISLIISINTLNANVWNIPTERHRLSYWITKQCCAVCCHKRYTTQIQCTYLTKRLKVNGKMCYTNTSQKKYGVTINFRQGNFRAKNITRYCSFTIITRSIHQEDIKIFNTHAPNSGALKCMEEN